jgi:hypothetical protein
MFLPVSLLLFISYPTEVKQPARKKNHAKVEHPTANFPVKEKFPKERRLPFKKRKENL